jgi:cytochrome b561
VAAGPNQENCCISSLFGLNCASIFNNGTKVEQAYPIASAIFRWFHKFQEFKVMTQYSKRMVIVHWLTLAMLIVAWYLGDSLADSTDGSKATLAGYLVHMAVGVSVLILVVSQLLFRRKDGTPPKLVDKPVFQAAAKGVHHLMYAVLLLLPLSGVLTVINGGAGKALLAWDANMLPKEHGYQNVFAHSVHEQLVNVLIGLAIVHLLGAMKHHFFMKDGLMERMMLRRKG